MLNQIADGRTDLVFEYLAQGHAADSQDGGGVSLMQWCAYYGDVSAIRFFGGKPRPQRRIIPRSLATLPVPHRARRGPQPPAAKFQAHCKNGIVTGVEQFDD